MPVPDRIGYADLYEVAPTSAIDRSGVRPLNEWMEILSSVHAGYLSVHTSDSPPASPLDGSFWWQSSSGRLFVRYNDGNSSQWVETVGRIAGDISEGLVTAPGGGTQTLGDWMSDLGSITGYGGDTDAVDNSAAIIAAEAVGKTFVPNGIFATSQASTALNGPFWGPGQIEDTQGRRAPWFSAIKAAPSSFGDSSSALTAFNGDLSHVQIAMEHRITGAATLGQPASGYLYTDEAYPFYGQLLNTSGHNESTSGAEGRTAAIFFRNIALNAGQADCVIYNGDVTVSGIKVGATNFLASPAGTIINGVVRAAAAGAYLNVVELNAVGGAHDCSGIGAVFNLDRDTASSALNTYWCGVRVQSTGSVDVDDAFFAYGKFDRGLTFAHADFDANEAAIVLASGQKQYWGATPGVGNTFRVSSLGTVSTYYDGTNIVNTAPITAINATDSASVRFASFSGDRATPANNDAAFASYYMSDDAGTQREVGRFGMIITAVAAATPSSAFAWSTLNNGTLTQELVLAGTSLFPNTNDGLALGVAGVGFSDLYLASGGVINWNNGNAAITHSTGLLTFSVPHAGPLTTPASAAATGVAGTIVWDTGFIYICTATNTWKRVAIATW